MAKVITQRSIFLQALVLRGLFGFTLGLYLFVYPLTIFEAVGGDANKYTPLLFGAVFTFGILLEALLELPLGALGDIKGYKFTLTGSFLFRSLYFVGLYFLTTPFILNHLDFSALLSFVTIGTFSIAYTLWSGTNSAWLYESVEKYGDESKYERFLSSILSMHYSALILGAIIGAWLYFNGKGDFAYGLGFLLSGVAMIFCHLVITDPYDKKKRDDLERLHLFEQLRRVISDAYRFCVKEKSLFLLIQLSAFFWLLVYVKDYLWPPYAMTAFSIKNLDIKWITIILVMTFGRLLGNYIIVRLPGYPSNGDIGEVWKRLFFACTLFAVPIAVLSLVGGFFMEPGNNLFYFFVVLVGVASFAVGAKEAPFDVLMNRSISNAHVEGNKKGPNEVRATIISASTIFNGIVVLLFFVPTTVFGKQNTIQAWIIPALLLLIVMTLTKKKVKGLK